MEKSMQNKTDVAPRQGGVVDKSASYVNHRNVCICVYRKFPIDTYRHMYTNEYTHVWLCMCICIYQYMHMYMYLYVHMSRCVCLTWPSLFHVSPMTRYHGLMAWSYKVYGHLGIRVSCSGYLVLM